MRFKPNELYGRVIEIGAMAPKDLTLESFLATFRSYVENGPLSPLSVMTFLDFLSAAARLSALPEGRQSKCEPTVYELAERERVIEVLARQIEDLRAMAENGQLGDPKRYFGIDAPSGQRWFNLDVHAFFECAATGSFHTLDPDGEELEFLPWRAVESFLWFGQAYE
jgi:hypothetical protein